MSRDELNEIRDQLGRIAWAMEAGLLVRMHHLHPGRKIEARTCGDCGCTIVGLLAVENDDGSTSAAPEFCPACHSPDWDKVWALRPVQEKR